LDESDDEVLELGTVRNSLSSEDESEDGDDDVVGVVLGALDDGVGEEELNSDVLEAVGSEEEGNTVPLNDVSEDGLGLLGVALVKHGLSLLEEGEEFNLEGESLVLNEWKWYGLELFELGIDLGLDEVEDIGDAVVLSGELLVLLKGVDSQDGDQEAGEDDGLHCDIKCVLKPVDLPCS
jgi:hypothetical protein